jgi:hypothetical protein
MPSFASISVNYGRLPLIATPFMLCMPKLPLSWQLDVNNHCLLGLVLCKMVSVSKKGGESISEKQKKCRFSIPKLETAKLNPNS